VNGALWFALGAVTATILVTRIMPANESNCCARVAYGARDTIAGKAGPLSGFVADALDALGLTKHLPSVLDELGVPLDG
jgi:hypothetical protein